MKDVRLLNQVAQMRRKWRFDTGSLALQQAKLFYDLDKKTGNPLQMHCYQSRESNKLVEEYMLLANMLVARQLTIFVPENALLRNHPPPSGHKKGVKLLGQLTEYVKRSFLVQILFFLCVCLPQLFLAVIGELNSTQALPAAFISRC